MKVIIVLLCLTKEVYNNYFATSLKLHFYAAVVLSCCNHSLLQIVLGALLILECNTHQFRQYHEDFCWQENGDGFSPLQTNAANDKVLHMKQEVPSITLSGLSECQYNGKCVKLIGWKLILLYYLIHITSALALSHFWWLVPVFSFMYRWWTPIEVSSETTIHTYWHFCSTYTSLHPLVGAWWWFGQYWHQNYPCSWGQG